MAVDRLAGLPGTDRRLVVAAPSADKLYEEVVALANDENPDRLLEAEDEIDRFLQALSARIREPRRSRATATTSS